MCGIAGIVGTPGTPREELARTAGLMASRLAHRGPDDHGVWTDSQRGVALAHRRLSIVDLSPNGRQPMLSGSGRYVISFNGEIYNYATIRRQLDETTPALLNWRGHSDTEVMLAAFDAWGIGAALQRLTGMFALAVWDRQEQVLHLARDRMGEKPLYYGWAGSAFLFGSELKALRAHPGFRPPVDRNSIALLLRHSYVPAPYTIYQGARKLLPGAIATLTLEQVARREWPAVAYYWTLREVAERGLASRSQMREEDATARLDALLRDAIARQMVADVPLGAFLSGGVDSSTVVALMQAQSTRPVRTFTIGFTESGFNEAGYAKAVARHLGTDHTELNVTSVEAMDVIPRLPELYDEPFADSSQIPTYLVARLARSAVTVSLSGDGGDELFGGYTRYLLGSRVWRAMSPLPKALRSGMARAISALNPGQWDTVFRRLGPVLPKSLRYSELGEKARKLAGILSTDSPDLMYRSLVSHWSDPDQVVIGAVEPVTRLSGAECPPRLTELNDRMMWLDALTYLPDDILVKVDRAAMGVSLETRVPLLDHRVVEFAWQLPLAMKIRGGRGKWILRQVLDRYVPRSLIERPKMGFGVPIDSWIRGPLREWAETLLGEDRLRSEGYFDVQAIRRKWTEHLTGQGNWQYLLWDVLMFQAWLEQHQP